MLLHFLTFHIVQLICNVCTDNQIEQPVVKLLMFLWTKRDIYVVCTTSDGKNLIQFQLILSHNLMLMLNGMHTRCLMVSTNQTDPACFYFRISWILMEWHWFYFFHPLHFLQGLRSLKHWLLQKLSMKSFDQKFRFLIKK